MIDKEELLSNKEFYKSFKSGEDLMSFFQLFYLYNIINYEKRNRYTSPGHHLYQRKPSSTQMVPRFEIFNNWCFIGIVFVKAEIISWFRIQEMFRLQSFHMYGVIGSAVVTGMISVWIIKKFKMKTIYGEKISIAPKTFNKGQIYGGLIFGFGWAITGACPGPLFAQIGTGAFAVIITLVSAVLGTWVYGYFRNNLPH